MHTESGHVTAVGIHTPTGSTPREMFRGFFDQFKRMKYLGASLTFVPVVTLPADPSQVSYEAGEPGIDPRDLVNPIMFHGCHGDDLGGILNKLYGDNDEISSSLDGIDYDGFGGGTQTPLALTLHRLYYKALTDKTWKKAHPQKGFRKSGLRPLVYDLAVNRQIGYGMEPFNAGDMNLGSNNVVQVIGGDPTSNYPVQQASNPTSSQGIQFMTPRLTSLGWIDTKNVLTSTVLLRTPGTGSVTEKMEAAIADGAVRQTNYAELPKLFMGVILLAPAYKTELYFRVIINHYFAFKDFRGVSFKPEVTGVPSYYDRNDDVFDINPTFPDLPSDFPGFGDDNGGDDNGGDDNGGDSTPVITLSSESPADSGVYHKYQIDDSEAVQLHVFNNYITVQITNDGGATQNVNVYGLEVVGDQILGIESGLVFDFETMKTDSNKSFVVINAGDNSDLVTLLQSGDYTVEVGE